MKKWNDIPDIELFTDGGAEPNPGKGGFGIILSYKGRKKEFSQGYKLTTNNRMELMGVIFGLERLKTNSNVQVYTDSKYVINGITQGWAEKWKSNGWKRKKNQKAINSDLWERLLDVIDEHEVNFNWVKGHAGHVENERCDFLANKALNADDLIEDKGYLNYLINRKEYENSKIENVGDKCRKCGTQVIKKTPRKREIKPNQLYYMEYYLFCPNCKRMYMVEKGKRFIQSGKELF